MEEILRRAWSIDTIMLDWDKGTYCALSAECLSDLPSWFWLADWQGQPEGGDEFDVTWQGGRRIFPL